MRRRIHPTALAGGVLAVGAGALYLSGLVLTGGDIPEGTTVRGVDIGGMSRSQAAEKLEKELAAAVSAPLKVTVGDKTDAVEPRTAGLRLDAEATADSAARPGGADPVTVIGDLLSSDGGEVEPVVRVDEDKARAALERLAKKYDRKVHEGSVVFHEGEPQQVRPVTGQKLDVDDAIGVLRTSYLADGRGPADLPVRETAPRIGAAETERALREFAQPAMSGPVTLTTGGKRITISPAVLGAYLKMEPDGGKGLVPKLDGKGLLADPAVARQVSVVTTEATEAKLRLNGDQVEVAADGRPGREVTAKTVTDVVMPLLTKSGTARTGEVATVTTQPKLTRDTVAKLGLKEKMSSFTVNFEPAPYRTKNIGRAAELINGSVVLPDETWSFNRTVGERTKENGFTEGIMILDGQYTKADGGGVSAVATTVFNALFFAGVKPVEYGAHSFYIERYPEGREATVAWGSLDLKFLNDSGNAIYVLAESTDSSVTVTFLGTKKYDSVEARKGPRTNVKQPSTRPGAKEDCVPQEPLEGFDVTVERIFRNDGEVVKQEPFRTRYTPRDEVTCP